MSSATSTRATDLPERTRNGTDEGFRVSHFFILLSLVAATVAVVMARPAAPENLVLISLTIGAAGLAAVLFYRTIAPLVSAPSAYGEEPVSERLRDDLEREKALTLRSIKELEFDRAMGKVSQQDFAQMADRLRARAVGIMKQLEAGSSIYREQVEKELAARLKSTGRPSRPASAAKACGCGTTNDADARFCKSCGAKLQGAA